MNSNVKSDSDLIATNRSVAKAVLAIHVIIAELANKKLRPTKGTEQNIRGTTLLPRSNRSYSKMTYNGALGDA